MGMEDADGLLRNGREALASADLEQAGSCCEAALALEEMPEALHGLSEVASRGRVRPRDRAQGAGLGVLPGRRRAGSG